MGGCCSVWQRCNCMLRGSGAVEGRRTCRGGRRSALPGVDVRVRRGTHDAVGRPSGVATRRDQCGPGHQRPRHSLEEPESVCMASAPRKRECGRPIGAYTQFLSRTRRLESGARGGSAIATGTWRRHRRGRSPRARRVDVRNRVVVRALLRLAELLRSGITRPRRSTSARPPGGRALRGRGRPARPRAERPPAAPACLRAR